MSDKVKKVLKPINPISSLKEGNMIKPISQVGLKDPEERIYIILYYAIIDGKDDKSFEVLEGRTKTRDFIIDMIEYLDIYESLVLVDGVDYEDSLSVYEFMKAMEIHYIDGFDIEDYNIQE